MGTRRWGEELKKSAMAALAASLLTFPLVAVKVNTVENVVVWRFALLGKIAWAVFCLSFLWRRLMVWKEAGSPKPDPREPASRRLLRRAGALGLLLLAYAPQLASDVAENGPDAARIPFLAVAVLLALLALSDFLLLPRPGRDLSLPLTASRLQALWSLRPARLGTIAAGGGLAAAYPLLFSPYQVNILTDALIFTVLGLGLNIVVGLAGLLVLGYAAFYAVGAYAYALLHLHFGLSFWLALPLGGALAALFGILLGLPVLRLRGDYLAIVTLGFGETVRLILENWGTFSHGPSGIANIPPPTLWGIAMTRSQSMVFVYYLMVAMMLFTIFAIRRLRDSRLGRSLEALREDETACEAMGVDAMRTKLAALALGATWAGLVGVIFAAKTQYINPMSFTFLESVIVLCIVVLGGQGSILGVAFAALAMRLMPEYLRDLKAYRMLFFGASLMLVMVFRPEGLLPGKRPLYRFRSEEEGGA